MRLLIRNMIGGAALTFMLVDTAAAAVLVTPPITVDFGATYVRCMLANIGTKPQVVRIEAFNASGVSVVDSGEITVDPGASQVNVFNTAAGSTVCKFTTKSKRSVRAVACVADFSSASCDALIEAH